MFVIRKKLILLFGFILSCAITPLLVVIYSAYMILCTIKKSSKITVILFFNIRIIKLMAFFIGVKNI